MPKISLEEKSNDHFIANPSFSRIIGAIIILTGKLRSLTMRLTIVACCQSFAPNTARAFSASVSVSGASSNGSPSKGGNSSFSEAILTTSGSGSHHND